MARRKTRRKNNNNAALWLLALGGVAWWTLRPKTAAASVGPFTWADCEACGFAGGLLHPEYGCLVGEKATEAARHALAAQGRDVHQEAAAFCSALAAAAGVVPTATGGDPASSFVESVVQPPETITETGMAEVAPDPLAGVERVPCTVVDPFGNVVPVPVPILPGQFPAEGCLSVPFIHTPLGVPVGPLPPAWGWSIPDPGA